MKSRLVFVDLFRGWAALVMIEVHVFNAFLLPSIRDEHWFKFLNFVNGLVAPSFLFVAGYVFVFVSGRKLDEFRTYGKAFWKQLQRIGLIWLIGYGLHLPFFSFTRMVNETTAEGWLRFYQADILHCIAIGMLIVFFGRIFIKKDRTYQRFLLGSSVVLVGVAPLLSDLDFTRWTHPMLAAYFNGQHYSQFPIVPWIGFLLAGAYFATLFVEARNNHKEFDHFRKLAFVSLALYAAGSILIELPFRFSSFVSTAIRANPLFFLTRLGIILFLMVVCWWYVEWRKTERSLIVDAGKETLFVYTAHLMVIYGQFFDDKSLAYLYGRQWTVLQCVAGTAGLVAAMIVAAELWNWVKKRSMPFARAVSYASLAGFLIVFYLRKGY